MELYGRFFNFLHKAGLCERRSYIRVYIKVPVTIVLPDGHTFSGTINNVSVEGAFIKSSDPVPPAVECKLLFNLPENTFKEEICGKLAWFKFFNSFFETGVKFTHISEHDRDLILRYNFEKHVK